MYAHTSVPISKLPHVDIISNVVARAMKLLAWGEDARPLMHKLYRGKFPEDASAPMPHTTWRHSLGGPVAAIRRAGLQSPKPRLQPAFDEFRLNHPYRGCADVVNSIMVQSTCP